MCGCNRVAWLGVWKGICLSVIWSALLVGSGLCAVINHIPIHHNNQNTRHENAGKRFGAPHNLTFSWDVLPVFWHSADPKGPLNRTTLEFISGHGFSIVTIEKYQALDEAPVGQSAEEKITAAAKQVKSVAPDAFVLFYLNSILDWYMYDLYNEVQTNPLYDQLLLHGAPLLNGSASICNTSKHNPLHVFNLTSNLMQAIWLNTIFKVFRGNPGLFNGVFVDRAQDVNWPSNCGGPLQADAAWNSGHVTMMLDLQNGLGEDFLVIGNDAQIVGLNGRMYECFGCKHNDYDSRNFSSDMWDFLHWVDQGVVIEVHGEECEGKYFGLALAGYLVGAEEYTYFACTNGWTVDDGGLTWYPEYSQPLGPPLGKATISLNTTTSMWTFERKFSSGVRVELNVPLTGEAKQSLACIWWTDGSTTGEGC